MVSMNKKGEIDDRKRKEGGKWSVTQVFGSVTQIWKMKREDKGELLQNFNTDSCEQTCRFMQGKTEKMHDKNSERNAVFGFVGWFALLELY